MKLGAKELRVSEPTEAQLKKIKRKPVFIVCDNVLDTYNIGSIFRLADAVAASGVYLCGKSETPPNSRIAKAAVGCEKWVKWQYAETAVEAIIELKKRHSRHSTRSSASSDRESDPRFREDDKNEGEDDKRGIKVIAIEQHPKAKDFRKVNYELLALTKEGSTMNHEPRTINHEQAIAFVVGHETEGVSKEVLGLCDEIVEIPMFGVNKSLNVMVSLAIVLYQCI